MGGVRCIGVLKEIRTRLGKGPGESIAVTLTPDSEERTVEVPADLRSALDEAGASTAFATLSYSHQREYVEWIEDAKRAETRARRITKTVEQL